MEVFTYSVAAEITKGDIEVKEYRGTRVRATFVSIGEWKQYLLWRFNNCKSGTAFPIELNTGPYPGINVNPAYILWLIF